MAPDDTTFMAESEEELKNLLMKVKEESEKPGLYHSIQKTKSMASSPIISWQIDGETMETVRDFILGGSKITADGDCSHEIKRCLLLGRKAMTNLHNVLKIRDSYVKFKNKIKLKKKDSKQQQQQQQQRDRKCNMIKNICLQSTANFLLFKD